MEREPGTPLPGGAAPDGAPLPADASEETGGASGVPAWDDQLEDVSIGGGPVRVPPRAQEPFQSKSSFLRQPVDRLPFDDDIPLKGGGEPQGRSRRAAKSTPFRPEDENRELKGCAVFAVLLVVGVGGWFLTKDVIVDLFKAAETSMSTPERATAPPLTQVDALKQKTVVEHEVQGQTVLGRKLVAPPEEQQAVTGAPPPPATATTAGIQGLAEVVADPSVESVLQAVSEQDVCYNGRRARRVPSLYGLDGGFGVVFGDVSENNGQPRLEFMPPSSGDTRVYFYASFTDAPVKGFEGREARSVRSTPRSVSRVVLAWVAELANGPCVKAPP
ncbi:hypothetical protein [Pararhodospirillum oryzae]|nr:hypothetical protein [Pararhodospirillum oryzae]